MQLFYTKEIRGNHAWFDEDEARHCSQVLRKQLGDSINFVDGLGGWYTGEIEELGKRQLVVKILSQQAGFGKRDFRLHLAVAPTKNIDRFEWFLEKATEMGVSEITPLLCEHSEREKIRTDRLEKILRSAMKQSLKAYLPILNEAIDFQRFIKTDATSSQAQRFIAHCRKPDLPHLKNNCAPGQDVTILIGPEGDFSQNEVDDAQHHGFTETSLGSSRLRTETAGVAAVFLVNFLNE